MLKGIGKYVVVMKNVNSDIIEEAIFILKENNPSKKKDVLKECEDIINKNVFINQKNKNKSISFRITMIILLIIALALSILLTLKLL